MATDLLLVEISAAETLEVHTAELTDNVLEELWLPMLLFTNEPRNHVFNLVAEQVIPIQAVIVALFAVELVFVLLVLFHLVVGAESVTAARVSAPDHLDGRR